MAELDYAAALQEITRDPRSWLLLARVDAVATHPSWGTLVTVTLMPRGVQAQVRMLYPGSGDGSGAAFPVSVGDEVLVAFPGGDPNQGVVLGGLPSKPRALPADWDNDTIRIDGGSEYDVEVHAGGTRVRVEAGSGDVHIEAVGEVYIDAATLIRAGGPLASELVKFEQFKLEFDAHVHGTAMGPSSTPLPLTQLVSTTKLKGE